MKIDDDLSIPIELSTEVTNVTYEPAPPRGPASSTSPPPFVATIAEAFQEMLWQAYRAGAGGCRGHDEACRAEFVAWYAEEVMK